MLYERSREELLLGGHPDFVVDCIDNVETKVDLLAACVAMQRSDSYHVGVSAARLQPADDEVAMFLYTSGSTGRPKGVPILHRGVHGLLFGNDYYAAGPGDRFLQTAPIAFDASVFDIWGALANGAELVFYRERIPTAATLGAAIADHRITTLWLTPSVFNGIAAEDPRIFAGVRQLVLGGGPLSPHHVRLLYDAVPDITVINGYGPTENSDFTCCYRVPRDLAAAHKAA